MIYEANEPSSACRLWRIFQVETSLSPAEDYEQLAAIIFTLSTLSRG